jgi:glycosyltransferase involved in cell wall biosynthesis
VGLGSPLFDKLTLPFRGALLARKLNKKSNYFCLWGIMVTFGSGAGYVFNILQTLTGKKRVPIILTLQEGDSENHLQYRWGGLIALSWKLSLWQTDFLTGISNFLLNRAKKNGYKGQFTLVPNGVDLSVFSQEIKPEVKNDFVSRLGKKPEDVFLVTSGRLTHKNAVDDVISALVNLPQNVHFIIIGKGGDGQKLQKQANDLGVSSRVKFVGFISYIDMPKYFSVCDIFIRPSRSEGFGNSFI